MRHPFHTALKIRWPPDLAAAGAGSSTLLSIIRISPRLVDPCTQCRPGQSRPAIPRRGKTHGQHVPQALPRAIKQLQSTLLLTSNAVGMGADMLVKQFQADYR